MAGLLKKLSLDAERPAGVKEVVAMVKEGGIGALKVRLVLWYICVHAACCFLGLPCVYFFWLSGRGVAGSS